MSRIWNFLFYILGINRCMDYIKNKDFYAALLKRKTVKEDSVDWIKNQDYMCRAIMLLTDRIATKFGHTISSLGLLMTSTIPM